MFRFYYYYYHVMFYGNDICNPTNGINITVCDVSQRLRFQFQMLVLMIRERRHRNTHDEVSLFYETHVIIGKGWWRVFDWSWLFLVIGNVLLAICSLFDTNNSANIRAITQVYTVGVVWYTYSDTVWVFYFSVYRYIL